MQGREIARPAGPAAQQTTDSGCRPSLPLLARHAARLQQPPVPPPPPPHRCWCWCCCQHFCTHRLGCLQACRLKHGAKRAVAHDTLCRIIERLLVGAAASDRGDDVRSCAAVILHDAALKHLQQQSIVCAAEAAAAALNSCQQRCQQFPPVCLFSDPLRVAASCRQWDC